MTILVGRITRLPAAVRVQAAHLCSWHGVRYNNCAFVLLGLVIEQVSGMTYHDYVREHIFAPAGMEGADYCAMDGTCPNVAEHYKRITHPDGTAGWRKDLNACPPIGSPDGGATVTALDLDRFVRAMRAGTLMSAGASAALLRPQVKRRATTVGSEWNGFAFEYDLRQDGTNRSISKEGMNAGVASHVVYQPATDTTWVLLANQGCDAWAIHREMARILARA